MKRSIREVVESVEIGGLGYTIEHGISADSIADEDLAHHWHNAQTAMQEINRILRAGGDDE